MCSTIWKWLELGRILTLNSRILKEGLIQDVRMLSQNCAPSRTGMCHYTSIIGPIDDLKILYSACWTSPELCSQRIRSINSGKKRGSTLLNEFFSRLCSNCIARRTKGVLADSSSCLAAPSGTMQCKVWLPWEASSDGPFPVHFRYVRSIFSQASSSRDSMSMSSDKNGYPWSTAWRSLR